MPIDPNDLLKDLQSKVNFSQNSWFRPETDFIRGVNETSIKLWNEKTGQAEKSQEIKDQLMPFLKSKNIAVNTSATYYGIAAKPSDYGRLASARIVVHNDTTLPDKGVDSGKCDGFKTDEEIKDEYYDNIKEAVCEIIDNQRWGSYVTHLTKGPTLEKPGITQINNSFKVAPRKISVIALDYYIEPTPATYLYSVTAGNPQTGSGDQIVYNPNSVKLQWPEQMKNEFLEELVKWYQLYIKDQVGNQINLSQKQVSG